MSNGKSYGVNLKVYQSDNTGLVSKKNIKLVEGDFLLLSQTIDTVNTRHETNAKYDKQ